MIDKDSASEKFSLSNFKKWIGYKVRFNVENPSYFWADGLVCFVGGQGSGKTLSAVNYVTKLMKKYPKAKLVTNLMLKYYPIVTFEEWVDSFNLLLKERHKNFDIKEVEAEYLHSIYRTTNRVFAFNNADDLSAYNNLTEGVIYLIDEIHLYFNSLESKNINPEVMVQIAQQRKQRKHIVATSQVFGRMAKPLREQFSAVIVCKKYFGCVQRNSLVDRDSVEESTDDQHLKGKVLKNFWFIHDPKMYARYDTYYTISKTKFISEEKKKGDFYDRDTNGI